MKDKVGPIAVAGAVVLLGVLFYFLYRANSSSNQSDYKKPAYHGPPSDNMPGGYRPGVPGTSSSNAGTNPSGR